ncbi:MAG TPA: hypothetical protein VFW71_06050 [Actinomycetota bacterium]|nr:hypothetical protein [Actinomycetota bacterium]
MIGVFVTFDCGSGFDAGKVAGIASHARSMFEGMPNLRHKFFTMDPDAGRATNFYVWESEEAARAFFNEALVERVTGLYGVAPTIEYVEIAETVTNPAS